MLITALLYFLLWLAIGILVLLQMIRWTKGDYEWRRLLTKNPLGVIVTWPVVLLLYGVGLALDVVAKLNGKVQDWFEKYVHEVHYGKSD